MSEQIKPDKITKPIQLLAAWLLGLILINAAFLTAASQIAKPDWASGTLVIASVINVPLFLISIFLLQTKFRPEMQEDTYYSKYLERKYNESSTIKTDKESIEEDERETEVVAELISKELVSTPQKDKKEKIETILKNRDKQRIEKRVGESRTLSQLFMYPDRWNTLVDKWKSNSNFIRDVEELAFYKVIKGDVNNPSTITLSELGQEIAKKLFEENKLWNQTQDRIID